MTRSRPHLAWLVLLPTLTVTAASAQQLLPPPECPAGFVYNPPPFGAGVIILDTGRSAAGGLSATYADIVHLRDCGTNRALTLGGGDCNCGYTGDPCSYPTPGFPYAMANCPRPNCYNGLYGNTDDGLSLQSCHAFGQNSLAIDLDIDYNYTTADAWVFLQLGLGTGTVAADVPLTHATNGPNRECIDNGVIVTKPLPGQPKNYRVQLTIAKTDDITPNRVFDDGETENYNILVYRATNGKYFAQLSNDDTATWEPMECQP